MNISFSLPTLLLPPIYALLFSLSSPFYLFNIFLGIRNRKTFHSEDQVGVLSCKGSPLFLVGLVFCMLVYSFIFFFSMKVVIFVKKKKKDQEEQLDGPRDKESLPLQPLKKHLPTKINEEGGDITKEFMLATPIGSHELLIKRILLIWENSNISFPLNKTQNILRRSWSLTLQLYYLSNPNHPKTPTIYSTFHFEKSELSSFSFSLGPPHAYVILLPETLHLSVTLLYFSNGLFSLVSLKFPIFFQWVRMSIEGMFNKILIFFF